jgi:hypothetical protein
MEGKSPEFNHKGARRNTKDRVIAKIASIAKIAEIEQQDYWTAI